MSPTRIFKFRAWHKIRNEMSPPFGLFAADYAYLSEAWIFDSLEEFELMQYTGLPDRFGKDIYEGDLLQWQQSKGVLRWRASQAAFVIDWFEGAADNLPDLRANLELMVIGNIYETPELLSQAGATA